MAGGEVPEQLLLRAKAGDVADLGRLFELYRNYLRLLVGVQLGRRLKSKVDESDVLQETFLDAHRQFPSFRGTSEAQLLAWLRQILAGNIAKVVRKYYGTQRRDPRLEQQLEDELEETSRGLAGGIAAAQSSPSQRVVRRELAVVLANALRDLPEDYRDVIMLAHLEGLPFPEVAMRMGRTVSSVKHLWARALARLRQIVGEDCESARR